MSKHKSRYGGAVLLRPDGQRPNKARQHREMVLIVIESDGFVEVYGDRSRLRVHIAHRLACPIESTKQRLLTEEILESQMPLWARQLYYPSNRLATGSVADCRAPNEEVQRLEALRWLQDLAEWGSKWTAATTTT